MDISGAETLLSVRFKIFTKVFKGFFKHHLGQSVAKTPQGFQEKAEVQKPKQLGTKAHSGCAFYASRLRLTLMSVFAC